MRFLVIQTPKDEVVGVAPAGDMIETILKHMEYFRELKQRGKIIEEGAFAGLRGGFGIFEVESLEELNRLINFAPASQYMHTEIYPLISREERERQLKEMLDRLTERLKVLA